MAEALADQSGTHLQTAKKRQENCGECPEAIQAAQTCIELSVKAVLTYLGLGFKKTHGWDGADLKDLAMHIGRRGVLEKLSKHHIHFNLPRLLFLASFWEKLYLAAKYGMEAGSLAPPGELFQRAEVELA